MKNNEIETWTVTVKAPDEMTDVDFSRVESTLPNDGELAVLVAQKLRESFRGEGLSVTVSCRLGSSAEVYV